MSKFHEAKKNVKKAPQKSVKEKRAEKREKKLTGKQSIHSLKVFEENEKEN